MNSLTPREKMWVENFHAHETPASLRLTTDYVNYLRPNDKVLEVGCAFGRITNFLAKKRGIVVTGIDINPDEIKYAQENSTNPKVNFAVMDGTQLEFSDNSFNAVVMVGVVGGVESEIRERILEEAYRVVRPGGTAAIAEFKIDLDDLNRVKKYKEDMVKIGEWGSKIVKRGNKILFITKHFTRDELTHLLTSAGFPSVRSREHFVTTVGISDGKVETRRQFTVWGIKPYV